MSYKLIDFLAIVLHNGDYNAAQQEIDEVMAEEYVRESEEEFNDWYQTCIVNKDQGK